MVRILLGKLVTLFWIGVLVVGCAATDESAIDDSSTAGQSYDYIIGPGDQLNVFVWQNPDISIVGVPVRPDGRVSMPLVEDIAASGKPPSQLARELERALAEYIKDPFVTVTVVGFVGETSEQVRVVGEATQPMALPYRADLTLLDVMIAVGGLTEFAAGNRANVIRTVGGQQQRIRARLGDLIKDGDISANLKMMPGDVLLIPESWF